MIIGLKTNSILQRNQLKFQAHRKEDEFFDG